MKQALLIGINEYGPQSGLARLRYAEADARELGRVLEERCGIAPTVLCGAQATQDRIWDTVESLEDGELFVFFFAGHGSLSKGHYRLHAADDTMAGRRAIRFDELAATFRHDLRYGNILTILDACRNEMGSARGARGFDHDSARTLRHAVEAEDKRIDILYGCSEGEFSYEEDTLGHGLMTSALIDALAKAEGHLTSDMLADLAAGNLRELCARHGRRQSLNRYYLPGPEKIVLMSGASAEPPPEPEGPVPRTTTTPTPESFSLIAKVKTTIPEEDLGLVRFHAYRKGARDSAQSWIDEHDPGKGKRLDLPEPGQYTVEARLYGIYAGETKADVDGRDVPVAVPVRVRDLDIVVNDNGGRPLQGVAARLSHGKHQLREGVTDGAGHVSFQRIACTDMTRREPASYSLSLQEARGVVGHVSTLAIPKASPKDRPVQVSISCPRIDCGIDRLYPLGREGELIAHWEPEPAVGARAFSMKACTELARKLAVWDPPPPDGKPERESTAYIDLKAPDGSILTKHRYLAITFSEPEECPLRMLFYTNLATRDGRATWVCYTSQKGKETVNECGEFEVPVPRDTAPANRTLLIDLHAEAHAGFRRRDIAGLVSLRFRGRSRIADILASSDPEALRANVPHGIPASVRFGQTLPFAHRGVVLPRKAVGALRQHVALIECLGRWGANVLLCHIPGWDAAHAPLTLDVRFEIETLSTATKGAGMELWVAIPPGDSRYCEPSGRGKFVEYAKSVLAAGADGIVVWAATTHGGDSVIIEDALPHAALIRELAAGIKSRFRGVCSEDYYGGAPRAPEYFEPVADAMPEDCVLLWGGFGKSPVTGDQLPCVGRPLLVLDSTFESSPVAGTGPYQGHGTELPKLVPGVLLSLGCDWPAASVPLRSAVAYLSQPGSYEPQAAYWQAAGEIGAMYWGTAGASAPAHQLGTAPAAVSLFPNATAITNTGQAARCPADFLSWRRGTIVFAIEVTTAHLDAPKNRYIFAHTTNWRDASGHPDSFSLSASSYFSGWRLQVHGKPSEGLDLRLAADDSVHGWRLFAIRWDREAGIVELSVDSGRWSAAGKLHGADCWPNPGEQPLYVGTYRTKYPGSEVNTRLRGLEIIPQWLNDRDLGRFAIDVGDPQERAGDERRGKTMSNPHFAADLERLTANGYDLAGILSPDTVIIVTGACVVCELLDRPIAERLRDMIDEKGDPSTGRRAVIISDKWYWEEDARWQSHPRITVGGPEVNSLAAAIADEHEAQALGQNQFLIERSRTVAVWGNGTCENAAAVGDFGRNRLDEWLQQVWQ